MATVTQAQRADAIITNCQQLILLAQVAMANPTPANIDAVFSAIEAGTATGALTPKPNTSMDGESYSWNEYINTLTTMVEKWVLLRQQLDNPFEIRTYAR